MPLAAWCDCESGQIIQPAGTQRRTNACLSGKPCTISFVFSRADGESGTGAVLAAIQGKAEATRQLAYRLYTLCERAGWAEDARAYNEIITSWSAIESAAAAMKDTAAVTPVRLGRKSRP